LIASSCSQRQIVDADTSVTANSITRRYSSAREKRPSGSPYRAGDSHATAFTAATCSGGETARATRARLVFQPPKTISEEPFSPLPDNPRCRVQPGRDLHVVQPLSGIQHDPRALPILKRQLLSPRATFKHHALLLGELDPMLSRTCHRDT
jgi:hypothetical protein